MNETHMKQAVALSRKGMELGHGGPFGAVIVRDGRAWSTILIRPQTMCAHAASLMAASVLFIID